MDGVIFHGILLGDGDQSHRTVHERFQCFDGIRLGLGIVGTRRRFQELTLEGHIGNGRFQNLADDGVGDRLEDSLRIIRQRLNGASNLLRNILLLLRRGVVGQGIHERLNVSAQQFGGVEHIGRSNDGILQALEFVILFNLDGLYNRFVGGVDGLLELHILVVQGLVLYMLVSSYITI